MSLRVDLVRSTDYVPGQQRLESRMSPIATISSIQFPENSSRKEFRPQKTFHFRVIRVDTLFSPKVHMGNPMQYRKCMELAEATITDRNVIRGQTAVEFTAFGVYARSLEGVGVKPGDYLAIKNAKVMQWDGKERLQMFVGLKLEDLGQRVAVLRGVEEALREVSSVGSNTAATNASSTEEGIRQSSPSPPKKSRSAAVPKKCRPAPPPAPVHVPVPAKLRERTYTGLRECTSLSRAVKYNAWAVVVSVSKWPGPTKGRKLMGQVYIRDPGFSGCQGKADMQFSLLADELAHFPPLVVGATMRIHNMLMEQFDRQRTGRVYDARSVVVIRNEGVDEDKFEPECGLDPAKLVFNEEDLSMARKMRLYWQRLAADAAVAGPSADAKEDR